MNTTLSNAENEARAILSDIVYHQQQRGAPTAAAAPLASFEHVERQYIRLGHLVPALLEQIEQLKKGS